MLLSMCPRPRRPVHRPPIANAKRPRRAAGLALAACAWALAGCGSGLSSDVDPFGFLALFGPPPPVCQPLQSNGGSGSTPSPTVTAAPDVGALVMQGTGFDLASVGYQQDEFFVSGDALAFTSAAALTEDGAWTTQYGVSAAYATRIVVHRPIDPQDFSGTVFVEWLNVSAGLDAAPGWTMGHVELIRQGHAWVGVSAQLVGVEGGGGLIPGLDLSLKAANPARYGTLVHPGDAWSYDIFSQAGQAVRAPAGLDPLGGLVPERVIATGESQSAARLVAYVNGVDPLARVFDAFIVHSRLGGAAPLSQDPLPAIAAPAVVRIRDDARVPVLVYQTETDVFVLGSFEDRQPDDDGYRLWEVAGTAHADAYTLGLGAVDVGTDTAVAKVSENDAPIPGLIQCALPVNSSPAHHYVYKAAVRAMDDWVACGTLPPVAERLATAGMPAALDRDATGNARGGIRNPWVDAPTAVLSGEGQSSGLCILFGTTRLLDAGELAARYASQSDYQAQVQASLDAAVAAGFILEDDTAVIEAAAAETMVSAVP